MTLFSNLIEFGQQLMELENELQCIPPVGFHAKVNQQSLFYESEMITNYNKRMPNRPYKYEQG